MLRPTRVLSAFIVPFLVVAFVVLFGFPRDTDRLFAWRMVPPMTPMTLGAVYLGGAYFFVQAFRATGDYHFVTVWRVAGMIEEVKNVLGDARTLPRWWPAVYLGVHVVEPGGPHGEGAVVDLHTKGWLPYTLRWTLHITEPITESGFALRATGDLEGTGRWTFMQDGPEVVVTYDWRLHATKPLLRRLGWLLKPAFAANHKWAMQRGEQSLRLELRRQRKDGIPGAPVPPPPPATFGFLQRAGRALKGTTGRAR